MRAQIRQKAFGQNFLIDAKIIQQIADQTLLRVKEQNIHTLVEIGPGKGAITRPLIAGIAHFSDDFSFRLIEKDRRLIAGLDKMIASQEPKIEIQEGDFLELTDQQIFCPSEASPDWAVVSNLPYSAATAILQRLMSFKPVPRFMVLMFQKEVADRLAAPVGDSHRGSLSVWTQNQFEVKRLIRVPPGAFRPSPKVQSSVILVEPRVEFQLTQSREYPELFQQMIKMAFAQRRKMIRNNFKSDAKWFRALQESQIDDQLRPENMDWSDWQSLFKSRVRVGEES